MPELPEVECVKESLIKHINGKEIKGLTILNPNLFWKINEEKLTNMIGATVCELTRRAKYIVIRTDKGSLVIHLGMTGKVLRKAKDYTLIKHDHLIFEFNDFLIIYNDVRRFGYIEWLDNNTELFERFLHLGPEPCDEEFSDIYLYEKIRMRKTTVKEALMESKIVVGIGNIYANEILFRARINPARKCHTLNKAEISAICRETKKTLAEAIQAGGSSLRDYVDADGKKGRFQESHLIYARTDKPCVVCEDIVVRMLQAGRASFICPTCQK